MAATPTGEDRAHLARAIAVAERARGLSSPNPAVGCVVVRDGAVVAEAATAPVGGPHAEVRALALAGEAARGASVYVTLEPCAHHGRTPPCTDALVAAGVTRVVYGLDDANPQARGGAATLRAAAIEVTGGVLAEWVDEQLEGFATTIARGRPHVTLKLAHGVDGRLTAGAGQDARRWLTGARARTAVHRWRSAVDGVLVGSGTVAADDPRLDVRHVAAPAGQPRAIVLDTRLRTRADAEVARPGTIVLTGPEADPRARESLEAAGADVEIVATGADGHLDLPAALGRLADLGLTSVLAEPGVTLSRALVAGGLVDRLVCHVAPDLGDGPLCLPVPVEVTGGPWHLERLGGAGADVILHLAAPEAAPAPAGATLAGATAAPVGADHPEEP